MATALVFFLVLLPLWWLAGRWHHDHLVIELAARETAHLGTRAGALSSSINRRFAKLEGLRAFTMSAASAPDLEARFATFASGLHTGSKGIRNFALAPGGTIHHIHPLKGNEKAIGHDLIHDPQTSGDVRRAMETGRTTLSGPYELRQGGLGLVARRAVVINGSFWGLATMTLDLPPLLVDALGEIGHDQLDLALRDSAGTVFHGDGRVFASRPVIQRIELPEGYWELAGAPRGGWDAAIAKPLMVFRGVGLLVCGLVALLFHVVIGRHESLTAAVAARTGEFTAKNEELQGEIARHRRTEEQLRQSREYHRALFEHSPTGLALCRMDGSMVDVNPAFAAIMGRTVEKTLRLTYWEITPEKYAVQEAEQFELLERVGRYGPYEKEYIHRDGHLVPVRLNGLIIERDGERFIWSAVEDITERKLVENEQERLLALAQSALAEAEGSGQRLAVILESISDAFVALDTDWRYTYVNERAARMFGRKREDLIGRNIWEEFPEGIGQPFHNAYYRAVEKQTPIQLEEYYPPYDRWFENRVYPSKDGLSIFFQDVTERKRAEEEVRRLNAVLEQRVEERTAELGRKTQEIRESRLALMNLVEDLNRKTAELERANVKLKEVDRLKSMFIASMSHELRTPLNSVIGFSSILLDEWIGPLNDEQKENLSTILRAGKHLLSLINDVIDVSKIEAGQIDSHVEDFDLRDVIAEAVAPLEKELREKRIELTVRATGHPMHSDRRRLLQCLLNLLSNAAKYTEHGGVLVAARLINSGVGGESAPPLWVEICVEDTGIGIGDSDQSKVFEPFSRLDSHLRSRVPGTGLGLYLTKKLVRELLKGDISFTSRQGEGSSFVLKVPTRIGEGA